MSTHNGLKHEHRRLQDGGVREPLSHLLVLLEDGAVAFCHNENPRFYSSAPPQWMAEDLLRAIVRHAGSNGIALTFLMGKTRPPAKLERLINSIEHASIVPLGLREICPDAILVLDSEESAAFAALSPDPGRNVILRVARAHLARLCDLCASLTGRFGRLSIHLRELEYFTESDIACYAAQLSQVARFMIGLYADGRKVEISVLTDRMMLREMRNCDAGVKHVTIAPDGQCAICPAFLNGGESIGRFDAKTGILVRQIGALECASGPLCVRCDAFHCKRCVWLSRTLTLEYNVPSWQQCAVAHAEREASRLLLKELGAVEPFRRMPRITELNYRDPLEMIDAPPVHWAAAQVRQT
jgi:CXXX repeat peptide maturase